ncbi:patatin [Sulfuricaulis limicola]|uniref:Patatin n=1 Tax=Sulfuricaulis limicola TaxID=1620215 RepID=A0A1B4XIR8_9GAMM|nr:patatin-like phospholipase RssA [Sulfuricaulis limicola]BAV34688.1 patatin [Sulfuricaulis limicola]
MKQLSTVRRTSPRIGLALGSGSARGWSHIGVIRVLEQAGISPDIVCGASMGALVGAAYAAGDLDRLETWAKGLTWKAVVGLLDLKIGGGLIAGTKLLSFFRARFEDPGIAKLPKAYAAVATELATGREVWLRDGPVIDAVRASIAVPGLFTPAEMDGRLLVDGGLVNPVPVSLCRAMGADIVIAVDVNSDLMGKQFHAPVESATPAPETTPGAFASIMAKMTPDFMRNGPKNPVEMPSMLDVLSTSLNIMQVRITRSRLAGEPADILIRPRLSDIASMDYHRAAPAITEGQRAAEQMLPELREFFGK